jgi:hypothetical protein
VVATSRHGGGGYDYGALVCELNGVGEMPSQILAARMAELGAGNVVEPRWTDARLKETAFGYIKLLLQQGRLELPNHPELLKQLRGLQFEQLQAGGVRIAVPERMGHDDLAMSLALAMTAVTGNDLPVLSDRVLQYEDLFDDEDDPLYEARGWSISPW